MTKQTPAKKQRSTSNPPTDTILKYVNKICTSKEFKAKKRMCYLFQYLVDKTIAGKAEQLKGYTIGVEVFNREKNFNPELDPIVRIQAGRLRRSLEFYYFEEGRNDLIRIFIPRGSYVPLFIPAEAERSIVGDKPKKVAKRESKSPEEPTIVILPFSNLTGDPEKEYFAAGFTEELTIELSKYDSIKIVSCGSIVDSNGNKDEAISSMKEMHTQFYIDGSIRAIDHHVKISIKLIESSTNEHIWSEQYQRDLTIDNLISIQEDIAHQTANIIASEYGVIPIKLTRESWKRKTKKMTTYEAILRFYHFEMHQTPETYRDAFYALEQTVKNDPECGLATAMLAVMYGQRYMLDTPDSEKALDKMIELGKKAIKIEPDHQFVRYIYAWIQFVLNKKESFLNEIEKCLALNPNSPVLIGVIGFFLCLYGQWEKGKTFLDQAFKQNVKLPAWYRGATTLYFYRKNDYKNAYQEALEYDTPGLFWGPMLLIACLGQLNRTQDAKTDLGLLKSFKPEFEKKARYLIDRYVKEEELVDRILEGLNKAGIKINEPLSISDPT